MGSVAAIRSLFSDRFPMCGSSIVFGISVIGWFVQPIVLLTKPTRSYEICHRIPGQRETSDNCKW